jgi:hypothetical protein
LAPVKCEVWIEGKKGWEQGRARGLGKIEAESQWQ